MNAPWTIALGIAGCLLLAVGCGPSSEGSSGGGDAGGDTGRSCRVIADGACVCAYRGISIGVCARQPLASDGTCAEPDGFEGTESSCSDGLDNDCDGDADCADPDCAGNSCGLGQGSAQCVGLECKELLCHDGVDNDEDGNTDCGDPDCTGETCEAGTDRVCPPASEWEPSEETSCDGQDNNCNGVVDEGCECVYDPTESNRVDRDGSHENGVCTGQTRSSEGTCEKPSEFQARTSVESSCSGDDNDCDGIVDEGCSCTYDPSETDNIDTDQSHENGLCPGQTRDPRGACREPLRFEEDESIRCADRLDNDCDGTIDETPRPKAVGESCRRDCECTTDYCADGTCVHRMFVTSIGVMGNMEERGAQPKRSFQSPDDMCQTLAGEANLVGTWKAVVSTSTDAKSRISIQAPIYNNNPAKRQKVADGMNHLWGAGSMALHNPIEYDETGKLVGTGGMTGLRAWSGTNSNGTAQGDNCLDWTTATRDSSTATGHSGKPKATDATWVSEGSGICGNEARVYCINGQ